MENFAQHSWPGNVRELINVLETATILCPHGELNVDFPDRLPSGKENVAAPLPCSSSDWLSLADLERRYIRQVLDKTSGKIYGPGGAREILGLKPSTLQSCMK
jgi:formate hydrogenlyase transcriptional activator